MLPAANFVIRLALQTEKGELVAQISRVGAALRYLSIDGAELVQSGDVDSLSPFCEGVIMSPWPNRIDGGKWTYQGRTLELPINLHDQQNSNHGLLMEHHYEVLAQTESSVTLGALIHARLGYPFNVQTSVTYELVEGGLRISHTAENLSTADAPYALGGHPYFKIAGVDTEDLFLRSDAATVLVVDDRQIPTGTMPTAHSRFDMRSGVRVGDNFYDHDFTAHLPNRPRWPWFRHLAGREFQARRDLHPRLLFRESRRCQAVCVRDRATDLGAKLVQLRARPDLAEAGAKILGNMGRKLQLVHLLFTLCS